MSSESKPKPSKEEYQQIQKRSLTQGDIFEPSATTVELSSTKQAASNDGDNTNTENEQRQTRLHSMSVDAFNDRLKTPWPNFSNHTFTKNLTHSLKISLYDSISQGLAGVTTANSIYHSSNKRRSHPQRGTRARGSIDRDNNQPLLSNDGDGSQSESPSKEQDAKNNDDKEKCTLFETALTSLGYMMSVTMLSTPFAVSSSGFSALIIMFAICIATLVTAIMLDELLDYYGNIVTNYSELVECILGEKAKLMCSIITIMELYIYAIAKFIFAGSLLYGIISNYIDDLALSNKDCIIIMTFVMMPLCHMTNLKPLSKLSGIGLCGIIITYIIVVIITITYQIDGKAATDISKDGLSGIENHFFTNGIKFGYGMGIIIAVFSFHTLMPNLKQGMKNPNDFRKIIYIVWMGVIPVLICIGFCGYLTFGNNTKDIITSNFTGVYSIIVLFLLIIKGGSSSANCMFPITLLVQGAIIRMECISGNNGNENSDNKNGQKSWKERVVRFVVPTVLVLIGLAIAVTVESFAFMSNLAGSICALSMTTIFPVFMYIAFILKVKNNGKTVENNMDYLKICVSVAALCLMVSLAVWNLLSLVYYGPSA